MVRTIGMMRKTIRKDVLGKRYLAGTNRLVEYSRNMAAVVRRTTPSHRGREGHVLGGVGHEGLGKGLVLTAGGHVEAVDPHEGAGLAALNVPEARDPGELVVDAGLVGGHEVGLQVVGDDLDRDRDALLVTG